MMSMDGKHGHGSGGHHDYHSFHGYEQQLRRVQGENEYLREKIKSCERGMVSLWQIIQSVDGSPARGRNHQYYRGTGSPKSDSHYSRGDEHLPKQVSMPELKEALQKMLTERVERISQLEDMKRVTEAAKRERVLAIDEKDKLLSKYHLTKVALERKEAVMNELEEEREKLITKCREQEDSVAALKQVNEEARQTRLMALDERAKVIEERNQLQLELNELQSERDHLFEEKVQLKGSLQELLSERRQLHRDMESTRSKCIRFESIARRLKEQNEVLCERELERHVIKMERAGQSQPWGFSIEGGHGSEYFSKDKSIVVTGIANGSPADGVLRYGDRLLMVNGQDFQSISRKKAAEILRSCDQLSLTMEISRIVSKLKPRAMGVHIPGKKTFGFQYETRLFVSAVEEDSAAGDSLQPGDEIVQVLGKPAVNLKLSHFKQILKSCRGGVSMQIHRMPGSHRGARLRPPALVPPSLLLHGGREGDHRSVGDFISPTSTTFQAPGTPGSNLSETTGYYSTQSTSLPSVCSAAISPGTPDIKTGTTGDPRFRRRPSPSLNLNLAPTQTSTSQHSGYETDRTSFDANSHFRESSIGSSTTPNTPYSVRLGEICPPYSRPLYLGGRGNHHSQASQSSYGGSSQLSSSVLSSSILSPKSEATTSSSLRYPYLNSRNHHPPPSSPFSSVIPRNSYSVDRLESHTPRRTSGDSHVTLLSGPHSMSSNNVYRMELGKRTNV